MPTFNMHQAKTQFSKLVQMVEAGEEVIIARDGEPAARLVPYDKAALEPRKPGGLEGKIWFAPDYDEADKEIEAMFYEAIEQDDDEGYFVAEPEGAYGKSN